MKKETLNFTVLLILGFVFEYLYFMTESAALGAKIHFLGTIFILMGTLGLWVFVILPFFNKKSKRAKM
ncbi:MAG: hypothetical protein ACI8YQ_000308 [Polaribacter sp.]|jgi:hypothetical protein